MRVLERKELILISTFVIAFIICITSAIVVKANANKKMNAKSNMESEVQEDDFVFEEDFDFEKMAEENAIENEVEENKAEEEKAEETPSNSSPYYIKINVQCNVVNVYTKDANGEYTVPYKAMLCSTGISTPPCGEYPNSIYKSKGKWEWGKMFGNVWGHYVTQITGNILFHSVPYTRRSPDSLEYWEFDKLGTSASLGCIRMQIKDVMWVYYNIPVGTTIEFYSSGDPGPFGKPSAPTISGNEQCRNWDPTDPDENNPWRNYKEPTPEQPTNTTPEPKPEVNNTTTNTASNVIINDVSTNTTANNVDEDNTTVDNTTPDIDINTNTTPPQIEDPIVNNTEENEEDDLNEVPKRPKS